MANITQIFRSAVAVTISLTSLADDAGATSSAIDNSTNVDLDSILEIKTKGLSGSASLVEIFIMDSNDGSEYSDVANARLVGTLQMNGTTAVVKTFRIKDIPSNFKVYIVNRSGAALSATGGDHVVTHQGVQYEVA